MGLEISDFTGKRAKFRTGNGQISRVITKDLTKRSHDKGLFVQRHDALGQPYEQWISLDRITAIER